MLPSLDRRRCALILVTGATGFLGMQVVQALAAQGTRVRAFARRASRARGTVMAAEEIWDGDVTDPNSIREAMQGAEAVVHLAATIRERGNQTFEEVNHQGTRTVAQEASKAGARHLVYVGAVGAADNPALPFLRSRWQAEQAVVQSGVPYTILRASFLYGDGDQFITTLAGVVKALPLVPVAGNGRARFQPLEVDEMATCVAQAVERDDLLSQTVELGGPEHLTYDEIIDILAREYQLRRGKVHIPLPLMSLPVRVLEAVAPRPPVTRLQLDMLRLDNVAELDTVQRVFGFAPTRLAENLGYIQSISWWDALRITLGFMPGHTQEH